MAREYRTPNVRNGDVEVRLSYRGIGKLLKSSKLAHDVRNRCERIADRADATLDDFGDTGDDEDMGHHRVTMRIGKSRVYGVVSTDSISAALGEEYDRNLTKAIDAGRDLG